MLNFLMALSIIANTLVIQVTNGTNPQEQLKNLTVTVYGFDDQNNVKYSKSFKLKRDRIVLRNLNKNLFYQAETDYKDVKYYSNAGKFEGDTLTLTLHVFDVTDKDKDIQLTNYHMVIFPNENSQGYYIVEALNLTNQGNETFNAQYYVYFYLPQGTDSITFIQPQNEEKWVVVGDTVFYNDVVYPGDQTIAFNYIAPGEKVNLYREFPKTLASAQIFTAPGIKIKSKLFKKEGEQNINGQTYIVYRLKKPSDKFSISVERGSTTAKSNVQIPVVIAVAIVVLVLIVLLRINAVKKKGKISTEAREQLEKLRKLLELKEEGLISKEEFNKSKKKICDKL